VGSGMLAAVALVAVLLWGLIAGKPAQKEPSEPSEQNKSLGQRLIPYAIPATLATWLVVGGQFTIKWMASS